MSSTYLTSSHMRAIERLLAEVRPALAHDTERHTAAARFLAERFEKGSEAHMRAILDEYVKGLDSHQDAISRWLNEGGAIGKSPRTEARRKVDNDTSGMRRRDSETAARHRLI